MRMSRIGLMMMASMIAAGSSVTTAQAKIRETLDPKYGSRQQRRKAQRDARKINRRQK